MKFESRSFVSFCTRWVTRGTKCWQHMDPLARVVLKAKRLAEKK